MARHHRVHPEAVSGCYTCRLLSVQVGPSATPSRSEARPGQYAYQQRFAAEFHNGDREAYRRLRADGLQPPTIAGSAHLERHATTRFEVESGRVFADKKRLHEALGVCADSGFDPLKAATTPKEE